jgi:biotin-dependent carboxylase-like uncharacterized protein
MAVAGGIDVPLVLGSRSTDLQAHIGGLAGRALLKGDELPVGVFNRERKQSIWLRLPYKSTPIRLIKGPEFDALTQASQQSITEQPHWKIMAQSNRMGFQLQGCKLHFQEPVSCLSYGAFAGLIQLPPSGQPIVLMKDAQTTGGYPRIASVITADLWRMAQIQPGESVTFEWVNTQQARQAAQVQRTYLQKTISILKAYYE